MDATGTPQVIVKIKKRKAHGHHGGAWKVAYADFVTAMMALFIVLWLLTQADLQLRQQIARYFRNPSVLSGGSTLGDVTAPAKTDRTRPLDATISLVQGVGDDLEALRGQARAIRETLERSPELEEIRERVQVAVTDEGLEIQVIDAVADRELLFAVGSAELRPAIVKLLRTLGPLLAALPNRLRIGGHTDARPFAPESGLTNWDLAFARANNSRKVLEGAGLRQNQVQAVIAYADMRPLNAADPLADENRRLSILALRDPEERQKDAAALAPSASSEPPSDEATGPASPETDGPVPPEADAAPRFLIPGLPPR
jgi:chemotaxis protein MotB